MKTIRDRCNDFFSLFCRTDNEFYSSDCVLSISTDPLAPKTLKMGPLPPLPTEVSYHYWQARSRYGTFNYSLDQNKTKVYNCNKRTFNATNNCEWRDWGANLGGGCRGCALPPPPTPKMTCGFLIQLIIYIKICMRHQSVTPFLLSGALVKKKKKKKKNTLLDWNKLTLLHT